MRRPRIALWIKHHPRWVPDWVVRWALRRVGKWRERQKQQELLDIWERQEAEQAERYAAMFKVTWEPFPRKDK